MPANEILDGRWNSVLTKLFAMKEGAPSPTLAPEIVPVVVLESQQAEWAFLANIRRGMASAGVGAVAAQFSQLVVRNTPNSGILTIVEQVWCRVVAAGQANAALQPGNTALVGETNATQNNIDSRSGVANALTTRVVFGTAVAVGGAAWRFTLPAGTATKILDFPIVLGPNAELVIGHNTANVAMDIAVQWRERPFNESETR